MDIRSAMELVKKANSGYHILKSYSGQLGYDEVFAFVISKGGTQNRFVIVYPDETVSDVDGIMAAMIVNSLIEVE
jgi:hypothetical protein